MPYRTRRTRRSRALRAVLALAIGLALGAESANAQNSFEQISLGGGGTDVPACYLDGTTNGGFTPADLGGYWSGVVISDSTEGNNPRLKGVDLGIDDQGQFGGYFPLDEQGNPDGDEFGGWLVSIDNDNESVTEHKIEAGSLQITNMGAISGTVYVEDMAEPGQISCFQLNESRDFVAGVSGPDAGEETVEVELAAFAKIDSDFDYTSADLEGTWAIFVYSDNILTNAGTNAQADGNDPSAGHGILELDASGAVVGGSAEGDDGPEAWPSGLQFTIDRYGRIRETSGALGGEPILQLAEGRQVAVGSAVGFLPLGNGDGEHRIIFLVKETSGVAASELAGDWLVFTYEDDEEANNPGTGQGNVSFDSTGTQLVGGLIHSSDEPENFHTVPPHTVEVEADGEVTITPDSIEAWGLDNSGSVVNTPTGTGFTAIAAGDFHNLALRNDGSIQAWGDDVYGQVANAPTGTGFTAIAAGAYHNVAIRGDGSLASWGDDIDGQVTNTPTDTGFTAVAAGGFHSLAIRGDGSIAAWGNDADGQVSGAPPRAGYIAVAAGWKHNLALRSDGSIAAWGNDSDGEVSNTPSGTGYIAIAAGYNSLALRSDGSIDAWGSDASGSVANTPTGTGFTAIAAGDFHNLALRDDGTIEAWGIDTLGPYGEPLSTPPGNDFVAIAAGGSGSLALRSDDSPLAFQYSPQAGIMIGTQATEGNRPQIILAFVPEPSGVQLALVALGALAAFRQRRPGRY